MPRSAATMLGFMLVAISIGFNTVRYPVVWEMIGPARAGETAQVAAASQPEEPDNVPTLPPENATAPQAEPAKPIAVNPAQEAAADNKVFGGADIPVCLESGDKQGRQECLPHRSENRGLVPVAAVSASGAAGNEAVGGAGIRRLPPVEKADADAVSRSLAQSFDGSIPVYPTTGIE